MAHANDLLNDVFTFLYFLRNNDVAPLGQRFLPPGTVNTLRPFLRVHDFPIEYSIRKERDCERLSFVHFLCEANGLVACTGGYLKPTPNAARWLDESSYRRARHLFQGALACDTPHTQRLWQAYRLPRWRTAAHGSPVTLLLKALTDAQPHGIKQHALMKVLTLLPAEDIPSKDLRTEFEHLLRHLAWFDAIRLQGSTVHLSIWGQTLLDSDKPLPADPVAQRLHLTAAGEIVAPQYVHWAEQYELADYATLIATHPQRRYRLDRTLIYRAMQAGTTVVQLRRVLERATRAALPSSVAATLDEWASQCKRVTLRQAILLETDTPERLTSIQANRLLRASLYRTITPRVAEIRTERMASLLAQLERRGLSPQVRLQRSISGLGSSSQRASPRKALRAFDEPTLAHLYVAARLCHALAEFISVRARPPYSVVLDVEAQLTPHDRAVGEQLVEDCVQQAQQMNRVSNRPADLPAPMVQRLTMLQDAIESGATLLMHYYTPTRGEASWRRIEPIQIDWRNGSAYLTAYCHQSQAERTFRVDRILNLQQAQP